MSVKAPEAGRESLLKSIHRGPNGEIGSATDKASEARRGCVSKGMEQ